MLKLTQISKIYKSKSGVPVTALSNVDMELGSRGMVFILGKSGSGKSTLLNILGGMDTPTAGEIEVDGVSMNSFKQSDLDGYRNGYVGFVFQEYNLLSDFNVKDNIAISLQFNGSEVNEKVIKALKEVELSEEYLTRRTGELSGGEKQRVAIARALVKDSKMILADEPTGNLDSATGESVWNILKRISEERLVVAVTHDKESAEKYGDRIIEIADGQIISDRGEKKQTESNEPLKLKKKRLPFAACFKMGFNSLRKHKIKTFVVMVLSIASVMALLISQMSIAANAERILARHINDAKVKHIAIARDIQDTTTLHRRKTYSTYSMRKLLEDNAVYIRNGIANSKSELLDFGLTFVGDAEELDDRSFYISQSALKEYMEAPFGGTVIENGVSKKISAYSYSELVGKQVQLKDFISQRPLRLAGILDDSDVALSDFFTRETLELTRHYNSIINSEAEVADIEINGISLHSQFALDKYDKYLSGMIHILTKDGLKTYDELQLAENEIIISFGMYKRIFENVDKSTYVDQYLTQCKAVPKYVGENCTFKINDYKTGTTFLDFGEVKLAGVAFDLFGDMDGNLRVFDSANRSQTLYNLLGKNGYIVKADSVDDLYGFLKEWSSENGYVESAGAILLQTGGFNNTSDFVYDLVNKFNSVSYIFAISAFVLLAVVFLLVINLISFSIANRRKEIGILSALGFSVGDVLKIFILETLFISVVTFVLGIAGIFVSATLINTALSSYWYLAGPFAFITPNILLFVTLATVSFGLLLLAAVIPSRKIAKCNPADAIRSL